jgi:putative acyl-CoA dehydrogenase
MNIASLPGKGSLHMSERVRHVETTHEVTNQPLPLEDYDAFGLDLPLRDAIAREGAPWIAERLDAYGRVVGSAESIALGQLANQNPPQLRTHDRYGHRIDEVEYHPAYHALMKQAMAHEVHSAAWSGRPRGHVAHAALLYMHSQAEAGTGCPLTMTHAAVPSLRVDAELAAEWLPRVLGSAYDPRARPASEKTSATVGMAMTEKQGGSDVRANTTRARPLGPRGPGEAYELTGHKWFCSAPMSDAFLTLAQTDGGLSCFFVPRFLPDGSRNRFLLQRLKDKLGNRSNASSEVEYDRTWASLVGDEGRGVPTIIQMVAQTRLDCAAGSSALMRQALLQAVHHARQRSAFGRRLIAQPLMQSVLADLALEVEGAVALTFRVARAHDESGDEAQRLFARVATAVAKYWVTHRAPGFTFEAMECLGGAGYVEESGLPRLYREAPVNSIWEGSGNVQCLDVLRALSREPAVAEALFAELRGVRGESALYDAHVARLESELSRPEHVERRARRLVEDAALAIAASVLMRHAPAAVADAFVATRLGERGLEYGARGDAIDADVLLGRALPGP